MFGLLTRSVRRPRSRPSHPPPRTRLCLERLEGRDCPSAPYVVFEYTHGPNRTVIIEGSVTEEFGDLESRSRGQSNAPPELTNYTVTFSGAVQGSVQTNADGSFAVTLTADSLGAFWGQTVNGNGEESNYYEQDLTNETPSLTLSRYQGVGGWVLTGSVSDEWAQGLTVTFSSWIAQVDGQTATVGYSNGFGFAFALPSGSGGGVVAATVTDWWGETSNQAYTYVG